jgi:hypothetical protein
VKSAKTKNSTRNFIINYHNWKGEKKWKQQHYLFLSYSYKFL